MAAAVQAARDLPALLAQSLRSARENCRVHHAPPCWMRLQQVTNHSTGEGRSLHRTSNSAAPEPTPSGPPGGGPRVEGTPLHGQKQTEARRLCRSSVHPSVHLSPILQLPPVHLPTYPACFIYQYVNSDYL